MIITINRKRVRAKKGETILNVAERHGIDIPALCAHPDLEITSNCRICIVEVNGKLEPSCSTKVEPGMKIRTESNDISRARKINLELIFSQHREECYDCIWNFNCELLKLANKYKVDIVRFIDRKDKFPVYKFGPSLIFDSSKCIDCRNCINMCNKQGIGYLTLKEKNNCNLVVPRKDRECIYCGQCIVHCPAGAFEAKGEFEDVEKALKGKVVVFQFAPSIRTSIGEEFDMKHGSVVTDKLTAGIRKLGAAKVFDVSVGADFTTTEEAKELIQRMKHRNLPMFTSCCPSWVRYVEVYEPKYIPNLTTTRSPHIILGGLIKTYWAKKEKINPKSIKVVSVMPCVAKKYEITRQELKINGLKPVDHVLTTRELAFLFKKHKIDLNTIKPEKRDDPLGIPSGAGVIYGASGGVMESGLRTAYEMITKKNMPKLEFKQVRGMKGCKKAKIKIGNRTLYVAVINGLGNVNMEELENYDYVEVMACPGGCIGGGGQPVPADSEIRSKRAKALYKIDRTKKHRIAHRNPRVEQVYKEYKGIHNITHTKFHAQKHKH